MDDLRQRLSWLFPTFPPAPGPAPSASAPHPGCPKLSAPCLGDKERHRRKSLLEALLPYVNCVRVCVCEFVCEWLYVNRYI